MDHAEQILQGLCSIDNRLQELLQVTPAGRKVVCVVNTVEFDPAIQNAIVLQPNPDRQGFIVNNESSDDIYLSFDQNKCSPKLFTIKVPAYSPEYYIPDNPAYPGAVRIYVRDTSGFCTITELSYQ